MGLDCRNSIGLGETETPPLEGAHKVLCTPGSREKAVTSQKPGPDLPASLGGSPGEAGVAVAHCGDKNTGGGGTREYSSL